MTSEQPAVGQDQENLALHRLEQLRPGVRLIALHSLGSADAADEAVQETLARAVTALSNGQLADPAKLPAFVAGIARHVIADTLRARGRVVSIDSVPAARHLSSDPDALGALVSADERARVRTELARLPAADRELLRLCYFEGLTPGEIAGHLGEPAERVRKRKSRALERLRRAFRGEPGHDESSSATEFESGVDP
ncbi:MAG TPA: sigma-70 family RNA polymerase sigma factor [Gemmatimonadales bacterium]